MRNAEIDKLRFRANRGLEPWDVFHQVGPEVQLLITEPTIRCPTTWICENDINPPALL